MAGFVRFLNRNTQPFKAELFPVAVPVDLSTANWAPVVWAAVIVISVAIYFLHGKSHYTPPVDFVEGRKKEGVGLQATT